MSHSNTIVRVDIHSSTNRTNLVTTRAISSPGVVLVEEAPLVFDATHIYDYSLEDSWTPVLFDALPATVGARLTQSRRHAMVYQSDQLSVLFHWIMYNRNTQKVLAHDTTSTASAIFSMLAKESASIASECTLYLFQHESDQGKERALDTVTLQIPYDIRIPLLRLAYLCLQKEWTIESCTQLHLSSHPPMVERKDDKEFAEVEQVYNEHFKAKWNRTLFKRWLRLLNVRAIQVRDELTNMVLGHAMYAHVSHMAPSCNPNAVLLFGYNGNVQVRSLRALAEHECITYSVSPVLQYTSLTYRTLFLQRYWSFYVGITSTMMHAAPCACPMCEDEKKLHAMAEELCTLEESIPMEQQQVQMHVGSAMMEALKAKPDTSTAELLKRFNDLSTNGEQTRTPILQKWVEVRASFERKLATFKEHFPHITDPAMWVDPQYYKIKLLEKLPHFDTLSWISSWNHLRELFERSQHLIDVRATNKVQLLTLGWSVLCGMTRHAALAQEVACMLETYLLIINHWPLHSVIQTILHAIMYDSRMYNPAMFIDPFLQLHNRCVLVGFPLPRLPLFLDTQHNATHSISIRYDTYQRLLFIILEWRKLHIGHVPKMPATMLSWFRSLETTLAQLEQDAPVWLFPPVDPWLALKQKHCRMQHQQEKLHAQQTLKRL
jgi:hypothetical protein